jgi:hypothetical protein
MSDDFVPKISGFSFRFKSQMNVCLFKKKMVVDHKCKSNSADQKKKENE